MKRSLVYYPDQILRQKARQVTDFGPDLPELVSDMREIMLNNSGMGLAAPQVGDSRRIITIEYDPGNDKSETAIPFTALVNPNITRKGTKADTMSEGCLSIPYVEIPIERTTEVTVEAFSITGEPIRIDAKGIMARIIQHEIDHLEGRLILDYEKPEISAKQKPNVVVWGSTQFTTAMMNVIRPYVSISHIVTEPAKPSGRRHELTPTVAKRYADMLGIKTIEPVDLNDPKVLTYLLGLKPDLMIVAAYGRLIPAKLYDLPKHGTLNVHPSLLPKYRGATPIQSAILNGDAETGVSLIRLAPTFDTGPLVAQAPYELTGDETFGELEVSLGEIGGELVNAVLPDYLAGNLQIMEQDDALVTKCRKIRPEDRWLDLAGNPVENERKVRAYDPNPGTFVLVDGVTMKVLSAHIENGELVLDTVQPAGKRPMAWDEFVRGHRGPLQFDPISTILTK